MKKFNSFPTNVCLEKGLRLNMDSEIVGNRVKEIMNSQNITTVELAKKMEISEKNLKNKLEGKEEFYLDEMHKIKEIFHLNLEELDRLFFKKDIKV